MKKTIVAGLAAVVTACGSGDSARPLQYGAPQPPTDAEKSARTTAQTTLQGSLTFTAPTQPATGAMGLADQLAGYLGTHSPSVSATAPQAEKSAGRAISEAFSTGGMDPTCVTLTATSATWNHCVITATDYPYPGDSITVTIDGTLGWDAGTRTTSWNILETYAATMTFPQYGTTTTNGTATLDGTITVTDATIVGGATSSMSVTTRAMGFTVTEAAQTTLALDLGYQADPFCIDSGTLTLEHVWTQRPTNAPMYQDQGWVFEWTGCNAFTVSHGS
jgi:hypothetical protein